MFIIEPCCTQKQIPILRRKLGTDGTMFFHGYGDLSLDELLPVLLTRYSEADLMVVAPTLPNASAKVLKKLMERQWPTLDGKNRLNGIGHLTLLTDLRKSRSPMASSWLEENPFPDRLTLLSAQQNDTAVILPDIALYGNMNFAYGGHFSGIATKRMKTIAELREMYLGLAHQ